MSCHITAFICGKIEKKNKGSEKLIGKKDLTAILSFFAVVSFLSYSGRQEAGVADWPVALFL